MTNKIQGRCPKCGELLEIPESLEQFSCLYCGAKLRQDELKPDIPEGNFEQSMQDYRNNVLRCVRDYDALQKSFNRSQYVNTFEEYQVVHTKTFSSLDLACRMQPDRRDAILRQAVVDFLDQLPALMEQDKRWKHKSSQERVVFDIKFAIALYMSPAVMRMELSISDDFAALLHEIWSERYPKSPYQPGSFAQISSGFRKRKLCFITTAICQHEGKPDDCAELTAFRQFRDGYLTAQVDGEALIREYYEIAPAIVTCIELCDEPARVYQSLRQDYLAPCYRDLQNGQLSRCKQRYVQMVQTLQAQYLS